MAYFSAAFDIAAIGKLTAHHERHDLHRVAFDWLWAIFAKFAHPTMSYLVGGRCHDRCEAGNDYHQLTRRNSVALIRRNEGPPRHCSVGVAVQSVHTYSS